MRFRIPCKWVLRTVEEIEASSLMEAEEKAMRLAGPYDVSAGELSAELFPVDLDRMAKMHPVQKEPDPMKGWKKVRDDAYDKSYERRFGDASVLVWSHDDPEGGIGPSFPDYRWTVSRKKDGFDMTSTKTFDAPEQAAEAALKMLKRIG